MVPYERLARTFNSSYDAAYWRRIRAFYSGGKTLLGDQPLLSDIFPRHMGEEDWIYSERIKRAFYVPYLPMILDWIVASLGGDPIHIESAPATTDPFYGEFFENCARPGSERTSVGQLLRDQVLTALLTRRAWTLIDLPALEGDTPAPTSRFEEEALGLTNAYALPVEPESVIDWERDERGELIWANVCVCERRRPDILASRSVTRETYTIYDREGWRRFVVEYSDAKGPPDDKAEIPLAAEGKHSFGRVPLVCLELPEGLWAGNKLESIARAHFNARNALSWGQYRSLFAILVATLESPSPTNPITEDVHRAVNQTVGPGRVWVGSEKDKLGYVAPPSDPFTFAGSDLDKLRDEMFRVVDQMSRSVDNSGAALQRSAESKQTDNASVVVVLRALGQRVREHAQNIYEMVSRGRGDVSLKWTAAGMDQFDQVSMDSFVNEAALLENVSIPSPTFQRLYKYELARRLVPGATDEQLEDIREDLERAITAEDLVAKPANDTTEPDEDDAEEPDKAAE